MAEKIAQELADHGRLIEAGWQIYRSMALRDVTAIPAIDRARETFEAGAAHLFSAIMTMLEPGLDETPADMRRMDAIAAEVQVIDAKLRLKYGPPSGSG